MVRFLEAWTNSPVVGYLDLSSNAFKGPISPTIGQLSSSKFLSLSTNWSFTRLWESLVCGQFGIMWSTIGYTLQKVIGIPCGNTQLRLWCRSRWSIQDFTSVSYMLIRSFPVGGFELEFTFVLLLLHSILGNLELSLIYWILWMLSASTKPLVWISNGILLGQWW